MSTTENRIQITCQCGTTHTFCSDLGEQVFNTSMAVLDATIEMDPLFVDCSCRMRHTCRITHKIEITKRAWDDDMWAEMQ